MLPALLVCAAVLGAAWWIHRSLSGREDRAALGMLQNQVNAASLQTTQQMDQLRGSLQTINSQITQSLDNTRKTVDTRLDSAAKVIQSVHHQLGELGESTKHIFDVGKDISSLQETLRSPKLRGNLGELFLADLLSQILPPGHYRMQHTFRGGETVDAVVVLQAGMVPVDAKFPLENFKRVVEAADDPTRVAARKAFVKDVKTHIDAIASKYIRTDENTFDFALMYIPAENVYYETIIKEDEMGGEMSLFNHALKKRVIPVSPNSLYAYLQTILLGLKGMRVEESARDIINNLGRLRKEFDRFSEAFRLTGRHLENAQTQYAASVGRLGKFEAKMEQIDGDVKGIGDESAGSLPPTST